MKKLIVGMIALCAAVAAQAAYIDWQYSTKEAYQAGTDWSSGYTAYLIEASAWNEIKDNVTASALASAATDSSGFILASSTKKGGDKYSTNVDGTATARQATANSGNYYIILGSATGYNIAVNNVSITAYNDPLQAGTGLTPGVTMNTSDAVAGTGISFTAYGGGSGGDEPEPTSGLLMLVGLGVLGLRRKMK